MKLTSLFLFLMMPVFSFAQEIIAHRGASYLAPENTLAAVKLGYELGADAVEVDVHLSKDQQVMVIHDKTTKRTAGKNLNVSNARVEKLRQLEVGSWKDENYRGEKIPVLSEVFALVPADKKLVVEVKSGVETIPPLQKLIAASGIEDRLIIISFDQEAIIAAKQQMPNVPAYWLLHSFIMTSHDKAIEIAKEHNLDGLDVNYRLVDEKFMQKMEVSNLVTYVYTVNDVETAEKLYYLGVKGITTDRPGWLREELEN